MLALPQCGHTVLQARCGHCLALQAEWYLRLKGDGFSDAENPELVNRPLREWTGVSFETTTRDGGVVVNLLDLITYQPTEGPLQTNFPESPMADKERFLHHPGFDDLCVRICAHGNHRLTPESIRAIWEAYTEGGTNRAIAKRLDINDTLVWRTISTLMQWMELMDLDEAPLLGPLSKVVLRAFSPGKDEAFIYASWRNALWFDDENKREGDSDRFYRRATHAIRAILSNPSTKVRIACLADSEDLIVGYSVITGLCLHFVYVKADYRGKRIGSLLVPKAVESVSPVLTKIGRAIAVKRGFIK